MAGRFIKLYDKILNWEWYSDINTFRLFLHLLLKANYKDARFEGKDILRGQLVTSLTSLASQTGLTVRQVRVSLDKLKMTGELTSNSYSKYRIITIVRYDEYQSNDRQNDRQMTSEMSGKRQANDKQMTSKVATSIDNIEQIEQIEKIEHRKSSSKTVFVPPTAEDIEKFCDERGVWLIDPQTFIDYYEATGWVMKNGQKMKNWKAAVRRWEARERDRRSEAYGDGIPW